MKPEEFEVYVIPPNFMEGGTLFGGLLKTRNTIEAVILGLAVGVPVLHLPFSLTVRVVILCLTALPLVLLALIGVSGMSLSAFIRLFFCFLHNRRILSRDGTQGGKNGKTLLPSWAQQRKSDCEAEDPPLPKSRSRFSVDLKQRSVTQFKTFLQEEEAVHPLNALADYIPIEKIEHGVIYTRDHRYVKVVEVVPVNFLLRSAREQRSIIYSFISYLKIAPVKVQFKALTKRADINRHLDTVRRELEHEQDPRCRVLQEDYLKLIRQLGSREAITRRFFLIFEYEPLPGTKRGHEEEDAIASLQTAARTAANYLRQCGNEVISPENEDDATAEILYNILCRRASSEPFYQRVKSVLADYMASGRDINTIPVNEFYAPDRIDLSHGSYLCIDGLYYGGSLVCATQDLNDFFALDDGKYGKGIINNSKTKILLNLEEEEAQRVQGVLHLSEAELMEITHFERGSALISTNNNNIAVEIKCSQMEKDLITTDRRELAELAQRAATKQNPS